MSKPMVALSQTPVKIAADIQTLSISSTTSLAPVRKVGEAKATSYGKGARTFAGTMVFTIIEKDPFQVIFGVDAVNNSLSVDGHWHIDQMPPFDAIIIAANETGGTAIQIIHGIVFSHWGTTYSIDDVFIESTYTYVADHVTPFLYNPLESTNMYDILSNIRDLRGLSSSESIDVFRGVDPRYTYISKDLNTPSPIQPQSITGPDIDSSLTKAFSSSIKQGATPGQILATSFFGPELFSQHPKQIHDGSIFDVI
jgi:hypothetical protein